VKHKEGSFKGYKDFKIYYQRWLPEGSTKAVLLVAHGFAEHSGRYGNLVNYFVPKGYAVYALDHRGHGRSDGARVQVDQFTDYLTDLKTFYDLVHKDNPNKKIFLVGHSMGAMISTAYTVKYQKELAGLILSGGGIVTGDTPLPIRTGRPLDASTLSHDKAVVDAYVNDPLVYRGPIPDRPAMDDTRKQLPQQVPAIKLPILIMAGAAALSGDGPRSKALYEAVGSKDKTLKLYEGLYHEIFNEPEYPQVMADMEAWLNAHM
jgi:alpha-beta hydrolase superfamily lysophospholipase